MAEPGECRRHGYSAVPIVHPSRCIDAAREGRGIVAPRSLIRTVTVLSAPAADAPHRYQLLADQLREALQSGRYPAGDRLPSVRDLCRLHGASLATVTHALHRLEDAGWIEARARQGFYARRMPATGATPTLPTIPPEALEARRERLMALAAARSDQLSLGHLALPDDLVPQSALRRLCHRHLRGRASALATGSVIGSPALREQVALRLNRRGCQVHAQDIVATQGEGESLRLCLDQLTAPGGRVAVTSPVPLRLLELLRAKGLDVVELPDPANEGARLDGARGALHALTRLMEVGGLTACVADMASAAAAGLLWDDSSRRALVALCTRHAVPLIECDLFGELAISADMPQPLKAYDTEDRVLHCGSTACVTGVGFGIGWVVSGRHRRQLGAARAVHGELLPELMDRVMADFLGSEEADRHLRRLRRQLRLRMGHWSDAILEAFPQGTTVQQGPLGYQLWVTLPSGMDAITLLTHAREHGLNFVPGAVFTSGPGWDRSLRLAGAHALDAQRQAALHRLGTLAQALWPGSAGRSLSSLSPTPVRPRRRA